MARITLKVMRHLGAQFRECGFDPTHEPVPPSIENALKSLPGGTTHSPGDPDELHGILQADRPRRGGSKA